jgi:hypothetical protein
MSNKNRLNNAMVILFITTVIAFIWLVVVSMVQNGVEYQSSNKTARTGLKCNTECIYNNRVVLQPARSVQKTQSAGSLHELSVDSEITPLEMLRTGTLK